MRFGESDALSIARISSSARLAGKTAQNRPPVFNSRAADRATSSILISLSCRAMAADALALLSALAAGDRVSLLKWEFGSEDMDPRRAAAMINAAREELADILRGEGRVSIPAPRCVGLDALFAKCSAMLRLNVSVRHVVGLVAVGGVRK